MEQSNAKYMLQNTYMTSQEYIDDLVSLFSGSIQIDKVPGVDRAVYRLDDGLQVVELIGSTSVEALCQLLDTESVREDEARIRQHMTHDIRREILKLHTPVKPAPTKIPSAENLQIRYIEVPGLVLPEYFDWRVETIFAHILRRDEIASFLAYHSHLSSTPGVTFYVEYEGSYENLMEGFSTMEYQEIIRQADKFIVGGNVNLSTRSYKRIYATPALTVSNLSRDERHA